jgi:hypothetical protein
MMRDQAHRPSGTVSQATKIPMLAVASTEVLETMFHCMPSDEDPYPARRFRWKYPCICSGVNPSQMSASSVRIHSQ